MKPATVHHICNRSTYDSVGRLALFLTQTMCGRLLAKPLLVTDSLKATTCGSCLRSMGVWLCTQKAPCCKRRNEYNGYGSGPLLFECPKHCSCHD